MMDYTHITVLLKIQPVYLLSWFSVGNILKRGCLSFRSAAFHMSALKDVQWAVGAQMLGFYLYTFLLNVVLFEHVSEK